MPSTKEEILEVLSALPLAKLEKLHSYATFLIIPDEDSLSNVTMQQMVEKANSLADSLFPEWTDRSNTDFGMFLVEIMALFSEKDFWYFNAFGNEALLSKMRVYSAAFIRAVELGHSPIVYTAANGSFNLGFAAGASTDYAPGTLIIINTDGVLYTNKTLFNVPLNAGSSIQAVTLHEGVYFSETYLFNGAGIFLRTKKIDPSTIRIFKDGVTEWTKVKVFGQSISSSEHFIVIPEEDGTCSIFFGEDGYGKTPEVGESFTVTFIACSGVGGNSAAEFFTIQKSISTRPVVSAELPTATVNGVDGETLASIKNTAQNYFTGKNTCFNIDTTEKFLSSQPEIAKAKAQVLGNIVNFYVQPKDGSIASGGLLSTLEARLLPFTVNGFDVSGNTTVYIPTTPIVADIYYLKGYDENTIITTAKQLISDYTNPVIFADYGDDFDLTELSTLLKSKIPGFQNIVFTSIAGVSPANVVVSSVQLLSKVLTTNITLTAYAVS